MTSNEHTNDWFCCTMPHINSKIYSSINTLLRNENEQFPMIIDASHRHKFSSTNCRRKLAMQNLSKTDDLRDSSALFGDAFLWFIFVWHFHTHFSHVCKLWQICKKVFFCCIYRSAEKLAKSLGLLHWGVKFNSLTHNRLLNSCMF